MQLVRKLLSLTRSHAGRNQKIRGLSTAELVGIIVIIGILGALGGTYIGSLVTTANTNTGNANAQSLNSVAASMLAAGVPITVSGSAGSYQYTIGAGTVVKAAQGPFSDAGLIGALNTGVPDPNNANVSYQLTPNVKTPASYVSANATDSGGTNVTALTWTYTAGDAP